jgi:hypothetical protein
MKKYTMFMAIGALLAVAQVQAKQHFSLVNKLDVPITVSVWGVEGSTVQELIKEFTLSAPHKNRFKGESFDMTKKCGVLLNLGFTISGHKYDKRYFLDGEAANNDFLLSATPDKNGFPMLAAQSDRGGNKTGYGVSLANNIALDKVRDLGSTGKSYVADQSPVQKGSNVQELSYKRARRNPLLGQQVDMPEEE